MNHDSEPRSRESGGPQPRRRAAISVFRRSAVRPGLQLGIALACLLAAASQAAAAPAHPASHGPAAVAAGHSKLPHEATAEWEHGTVQLTCTGVTWTYSGFPEAQGNAVTEAIFVDHSELSAALAVFDGLTGSHTTPLMQSPGRHRFKVRAKWHTNGLVRAILHSRQDQLPGHAVVLGRRPPGSRRRRRLHLIRHHGAGGSDGRLAGRRP